MTCEGGEEGGGEDVDGCREKHSAQQSEAQRVRQNLHTPA